MFPPGVLRVDSKRPQDGDGYVTVPGWSHDIIVKDLLGRNRAYHGDEVAVQLSDEVCDRPFFSSAPPTSP